MTAIALTHYGKTETFQPTRINAVRTTATVVDRRPRTRSSGRSLADSVRSYYATKVTLIAGSLSLAAMAGAFIGKL